MSGSASAMASAAAKSNASQLSPSCGHADLRAVRKGYGNNLHPRTVNRGTALAGLHRLRRCGFPGARNADAGPFVRCSRRRRLAAAAGAPRRNARGCSEQPTALRAWSRRRPDGRPRTPLAAVVGRHIGLQSVSELRHGVERIADQGVQAVRRLVARDDRGRIFVYRLHRRGFEHSTHEFVRLDRRQIRDPLIAVRRIQSHPHLRRIDPSSEIPCGTVAKSLPEIRRFGFRRRRERNR